MPANDRPRRVLHHRATPDGRITSDIPQPCCVPVLLATRDGRRGAGHAAYCPVFLYIGFEGAADPSPVDEVGDEP